MGDMADGILDGIFDQETGEFIDDKLSAEGGPGYPRSMSNGNYYFTKGKKNKRNPIHGKVRMYMHSNPIIKNMDLNKNGVISFIHRFYKSIGVSKARSKHWTRYKSIIAEHEIQFKKYCQNYKG